MTYSVTIDGEIACIAKAEQGRYQSPLDAITAIMVAAKDIDITSIHMNGMVYSTMDSFTGGLLNTSRIVEAITGEKIADESLTNRFKTSFLSILSTYLAGLRFDSNDAESSFNARHSLLHRKEEKSFASPLNYRVFRLRR